MFAYSESEKKYLNVSMLKSLEIKLVEEFTIQVVGEYSDGGKVILKSFKANYELQPRDELQLTQLQKQLDIEQNNFDQKSYKKIERFKKRKEDIKKQIRVIESRIQKNKQKVLPKVIAEAEQYIVFVLSGRNIPQGANGVDAAMAGFTVTEGVFAVTDIIGILTE